MFGILKQHGIDLKPVDDEKFTLLMKEASMDPAREEQLMWIINAKEADTGKGLARVIRDSSWSKALLKSYKMGWTEIDQVYLNKVISYMLKTNFLTL
jgi:hypothetical protein